MSAYKISAFHLDNAKSAMIYEAKENICLKALISGITGSISTIIFVLDTPFIKEGYSL